MEKFKDLIIHPEMTVVEAMAAIDKGAVGAAFICSNDKLQAVVTDGDIRRHIIQGLSLGDSISNIGNKEFKFARTSDSVTVVLKKMKEYKVPFLPVLDENGMLQDVQFMNRTLNQNFQELNLPVVIMAGGKGTRLYPYTKVLPKPLIPIGDKTITELIMNQFVPYHCNDFFMIVNHKKNMIKAFFADEEFSYNVDFIDEDIPMGTGGGLKLLEGKIDKTFFLTNCDILISEDYSKIVEFHQSQNNIITVVCATKTVTIPYGTVEVNEQGKIKTMSEKPSFSFLTNTGLYLIEPEFLEYIPKNKFIHITDIIQICIDANKSVGMYPVSENQWSDMGQIEEMEKMREKLGYL